MFKQKREQSCCNQHRFSACRHQRDIWLCNLDWTIKKLRRGKKTTKETDEPLTSNATEVHKHEENIEEPVVATRKALPHKPGYPE